MVFINICRVRCMESNLNALVDEVPMVECPSSPRQLQVPGMGACFGSCRMKQRSRKIVVARCLYKAKSDEIEMDLLIDNEAKMWQEVIWTASERLPAHLPSEDGKEAFEVEDSMRYVGAMHRSNLYLDPYALLANRAVRQVPASLASSTPPSSLELEWENDEPFLPAAPKFGVKTKSLPSSTQDPSSGCEGGEESPESLEWDPCEEASSTDLETERLLVEIESLTRRALQETGCWTGSRE